MGEALESRVTGYKSHMQSGKMERGLSTGEVKGRLHYSKGGGGDTNHVRDSYYFIFPYNCVCVCLKSTYSTWADKCSPQEPESNTKIQCLVWEASTQVVGQGSPSDFWAMHANGCCPWLPLRVWKLWTRDLEDSRILEIQPGSNL